MEESTEAHMETDVSSTTEDVPETQEVTGSNGNVEMVIVVEKLEEDIDSNVQSEKEPDDKIINEVFKAIEESPPIDTEVQKSLTKSPIKDMEIVTSPSKAELAQKVVNKSLQLDSEIELSAHTQQTEDADSSMKDSLLIDNEEKPKSSQDSPKKVQKKSIENSPKKDVLKPVPMSPSKEVQLNESTRSTPTKESLLVEKFIINGKIQSNDASNDSSCKNITTIIPIDITIERDTSNDSQLEKYSVDTNMSDLSDREHNKSISRELKSLINSAKESKIISECTQLTSKTRKSRSALDSSSTGLNTSADADKIQGVRRNSNNSQKSNCSEKSEKVTVKRSMRSQNPEFVSKVKQFLNSVTGKGHKDSDDDDEAEEKGSKDKMKNDALSSPPKIRKTEPIILERPGKLRTDSYCWRCHWAVEQGTEKAHNPMHCTVCPRSFHFKCLSGNERNKINAEKSWVCPECMIILQAESSETRSQAMKKISLGMLCDLLKHALERMMDVNGVEPFMQPVDRAAFPDYDKYVVHPMDLSLMKKNINDGLYGSTESFLADAQWILHNSIIFNTLQSKLTGGARALVRSCRAETGEIEACPECYAAAHQRRHTWFTDVCTTPHILLWAKLKGFPYWPAKGMSVSGAGHVDVRFFGAHDRAWVPAKDCFLYSEKDPNNFRTKRQDIIDSMQEAEEHIRNISRKYGKFVYPPFRTQFEPAKMYEQLKMMIPAFEGDVGANKSNAPPAGAKEKSRSISKSSKSSFNDGEMSENEEAHDGEHSTNVPSRKMADGAEIAREEEDTNAEKPDIVIEVDSSSKTSELSSRTSTTSEPASQSNKSSESSRKRRRSELEEAVITIMETAPAPKRKKSENKQEKDKKKSHEQEPSSSKESDDKSETVDKSKSRASNDAEHDENEVIDNETSGNTRPDPEKEKQQRVTPIRIALVQKERRHNLRTSTVKEAMAKIITPVKDKDKDNERTTPLRQKRTEKAEKASDKTPKDDKLTRSEKRRDSRNNRSLTSTPKSDKPRRISIEKKTEKTAEASSSKENSKEKAKENNKEKAKENAKEKGKENNKEKAKEGVATNKEKDTESDKSKKEKLAPAGSPKPTNVEPTRSVKDRLQFDDDTTLAVIARETRTVVISNDEPCMPTISSVRSLSTTTQNTGTTLIKINTSTTAPDVTIEPISDVSTVPPASTDSGNNIKDTATLQKLRNDAEPLVGRVGVRAFARMPSIEKTPNKKDDVQVEIKAEPIDVDDADRHSEKLNLMNAFRLRPVNHPIPAPTNLREVRINKVLVTPLSTKKTATKASEVRPKAKKTFPQPKKPEDGQLNSKNSMVYIPIQPPMTQAPVRPPRVVAGPTCLPPSGKAAGASSTSTNSLVNTVTTPVMQVSSMVTSPPSSTTTTSASLSTVGSLGQMPTAVHTVPLMTSVNGQWMFSFQPVMSVGAIDNSPSPPILNGVAERSTGAASTVLQSHTHTHVPAHAHTHAGAAAPPACASTTADTSAPGEPPRLQQRPTTVLLNPLDANTPIGHMPTPSTAGPVTAKLNQNAVKLTDFFRTLLEDSLEKLDEPATQLTTLKLQLEQAKWKHQAEIKEIKHNHELTLAEMRALFEKEKGRAVAEARRTAHAELEAAVKATKAKQWCANCSQEAQFYCCWNTSYCDYPCQRAHWSQHFNVCTQQRPDGSNNGEPPAPPENRLQPQPDNLPKNSSAPALTVGGKLAPSRVYTQDPHNPAAQKSAIIVSMVEDQSGNQTMKCVGTYKSSPAQNVSPIIINKQIMNSEENANKKVVSSGGYLIVGGGSNNSAVVTPARRTHTIQYFS